MALVTTANGDAARIAASGLFDADWYAAAYPDVRSSGLDPLAHYLAYGARLNRDPGPAFSARFHLHLHGTRKVGPRGALLHHLANPGDSGVAELVLRAAHALADEGRFDMALRLAGQRLPADLRPALASLHLRRAADLGAEVDWITALNGYLATFGQSALALAPGAGELLSRLRPAAPVAPVTEGPLVTVLMPVFNAEATLRFAVASILGQSWRNLELLAVDDASTDGSWAILQEMAAQDPRLRPLRLTRNCGPYVAKTLALEVARGAWITGQDADDWSHPQRIERQMAGQGPRPTPVSLAWGLRLTPQGRPSHISRARRETSSDGFTRRVPISALFDAGFLRQRLGAWDSVRFGADTNLLLLAEHILRRPNQEEPLIAMLCRDAPDSLSNDPLHGTRASGGGFSDTRRSYLDGFRAWLATQSPDGDLALPFPHLPRRFPVPPAMHIPVDQLLAVRLRDGALARSE